MAQLPDAPFTVHFTEAVTVSLTHWRAEVFAYGQSLEITPEIMELNRDREGRCQLLQRVEANAGVHLGPWPEGISRLLPGSFEWREEREQARQRAHKIEDRYQRSEALQAVEDEFGPQTTSKTLAHIGERP